MLHGKRVNKLNTKCTLQNENILFWRNAKNRVIQNIEGIDVFSKGIREAREL